MYYDQAKMSSDYFNCVFSNKKTKIASPTISVKSDNTLANIVFSEVDVVNVLRKLDVNKGAGPDDISLKVLREYADELAPSLTTLFNHSIVVNLVFKSIALCLRPQPPNLGIAK